MAVDATKDRPDRARKETLWLPRRIGRYGPPPGWYAGQRDVTLDREREEREAECDELLRDVAQSLVAFQHDYALSTGEAPNAMPGSAVHRATLVGIAEKALAALGAREPATTADTGPGRNRTPASDGSKRVVPVTAPETELK